MSKFLIFLLFVFFIFSCAQQSQPLSGGLKDSIPPRLVFSIPLDSNSVNYKATKVRLTFNEFFVLSNSDKEFLCSPPFNKKVKLKVVRKNLEITFPDSLLDSVTYFLKFGNSIADFHENNVLKDFTFAFSTYSVFDTLEVSGKVVDAWTFMPVNGIYVMLYNKFNDSLPLQKIPLYVTKSDSNGFFTFKHIKEGKYKIFALNDLNNNLVYNDDENMIAFSDSVIKPFVINKIEIDTLDSGYVFKNKVDTTKVDTLTRDTIVIKRISNYYPDSLKLLFFADQKKMQSVKRSVRDSKALIMLSFVKPIIHDYFKVTDISNKQLNCYFQNYPSKDSIYFWIKDSTIFNKDTVKLIANYYENDSLIKFDTLTFNNYNYSTDSLKLKFKIFDDKLKLTDSLKFTSNFPVLSVDSLKLHIYQIIDTIVKDEKKQEISVLRAQYDSLVCKFSRPIISLFNISFKNYDNKNIPIVWKHNDSKTEYYCKIQDAKLYNLDSLKFSVSYDNLYFYDQIQKFKSDFSLKVTSQNLKSAQRPTQDTIVLEFVKDINKLNKIDFVGYKADDFLYSIDKNKILVVLKNKTAQNTDTLKFYVDIFDMKKLDNSEVNFKDTIQVKYTFDAEKITYSRRYQRSRVLLAFKKPLREIPEIKLISMKVDGRWYALNINSSRDTLTVSITNQLVVRLNNLRFAVDYYDINHHNDTIRFSDTLSLETEGLENTKLEVVGNEKKITVYKPLNFKTFIDSLLPIKLTFYSSDFKPGLKYKFDIDSAAFKDIYQKTNDTATFKFVVLSAEEYSPLTINITNICAVVDTIDFDTAGFYILPRGQLVLQMLDKNDEVAKQIIFKNNSKFVDPMVPPGTYSLRVYYDENSNGIWDSGNYLKHKQPEKVFIYSKSLNLSKGKGETVNWNLYDKSD